MRRTDQNIDFTVAILAYNAEKRLPRLLDSLLQQTKTGNISWEVIVVDNNSTDNSAQVIKNYQANWTEKCPLRYLFESRQGAAFARQMAVEESRGEFVGFLDDDNLPKPDWIERAYRFGKEHPKAGAWGSQVHAEFKTEPPKNFNRIASFLAITERGPRAQLYEPRKKIFPPAGGLVIRRKVWVDSVPKVLFLNTIGRERWLAGEDVEALLFIQKARWEIWYNPEMQIQHLIPADRLKKDYLMKLCFKTGLSRYIFRLLRVRSWERPFVILGCMVKDMLKILDYIIRHRWQIKTDIVTACEMQFYLGTFVSPFYFWSRKPYSRRRYKV